MTAEEWLDAHCKEQGIDWEKLTLGERFKVTMHIPCSIRCFRVGVPVPVAPGEKCDECGKYVPLQTSWEKLPLEI